MFKLFIKFSAASILFFGASSQLFAQDADSAIDFKADNEVRIILYEHPNYEGKTLPLYEAGEISNLRDKDRGATGDWNDKVSSIEFNGNFTLTLYTDSNFEGKSVTIKTSQSNLYSLNNFNFEDKISSVRWEPTDGSEQPVITEKAFFYDSPKFRGKSFVLYSDQSIKDLKNKKRGSIIKNFNDQIRSVKILGEGTSVTLFANKSYGGSRLTLTESATNLADLDFDKKASSVKVTAE